MIPGARAAPAILQALPEEVAVANQAAAAAVVVAAARVLKVAVAEAAVMAGVEAVARV